MQEVPNLIMAARLIDKGQKMRQQGQILQLAGLNWALFRKYGWI